MTATRTGPKAWRGLSPSPSTSEARSASSISAVDQCCEAGEGVVGGRDDLAAGVVDLRRAGPSVVLVDEEEAEHVDGLGELVHPLGDQRHRQLEQPGVGVVDRVADDAGGLEVRAAPGG